MQTHDETTGWDRIGIAAVMMLIGAFLVGAITPFARGTGVSRSVSDSGDGTKNTKTGTTRGTGKSKSVSNSS